MVLELITFKQGPKTNIKNMITRPLETERNCQPLNA